MKHKVISRAVAYHGTPQGALSITGIPRRRCTSSRWCRRAQGGEHELLPGAGARRRPRGVRPLGRRLDRRAIEMEGPDTSPPCSSSRCRTPAAASRRRPATSPGARDLRRYDVLLVSDEVICAFGRLGTTFGCDKFGYQPDIITCAKGMTSGYSPSAP
jgi:hypothetical protein